MSMFHYENTELYYEMFEGQHPVLLIHGWGIDHHYFTGCMEPVFNQFPGQFRRFYIDLPGMGNSVPGNVQNSDDVLDVLCAFIQEKIYPNPFLIVGNSYGGMLARVITQRMPELVRAMILLCPAERFFLHECESDQRSLAAF